MSVVLCSLGQPSTCRGLQGTHRHMLLLKDLSRSTEPSRFMPLAPGSVAQGLGIPAGMNELTGISYVCKWFAEAGPAQPASPLKSMELPWY